MPLPELPAGGAGVGWSLSEANAKLSGMGASKPRDHSQYVVQRQWLVASPPSAPVGDVGVNVEVQTRLPDPVPVLSGLRPEVGSWIVQRFSVFLKNLLPHPHSGCPSSPSHQRSTPSSPAVVVSVLILFLQEPSSWV